MIIYFHLGFGHQKNEPLTLSLFSEEIVCLALGWSQSSTQGTGNALSELD